MQLRKCKKPISKGNVLWLGIVVVCISIILKTNKNLAMKNLLLHFLFITARKIVVFVLAILYWTA